MTARVVIAVRGGLDAKSRCAALLSGPDRALLVGAMLSDMLEAIDRAETVAGVCVVTPSPDLAEISAAAGADVILEPAVGGLGAAFDRARGGVAARDPHARTLLLPGDLPLLDPAELDILISAWRPGGAVMVPAKADGGTGAILLPADLPFEFSYGPGSLVRHAAAARAAGLVPHLLNLPSLAFDLDRPADITELLAAPAPTRTRMLLASQSISKEIAA